MFGNMAKKDLQELDTELLREIIPVLMYVYGPSYIVVVWLWLFISKYVDVRQTVVVVVVTAEAAFKYANHKRTGESIAGESVRQQHCSLGSTELASIRWARDSPYK